MRTDRGTDTSCALLLEVKCRPITFNLGQAIRRIRWTICTVAHTGRSGRSPLSLRVWGKTAVDIMDHQSEDSHLILIDLGIILIV